MRKDIIMIFFFFKLPCVLQCFSFCQHTKCFYWNWHIYVTGSVVFVLWKPIMNFLCLIPKPKLKNKQTNRSYIYNTLSWITVQGPQRLLKNWRTVWKHLWYKISIDPKLAPNTRIAQQHKTSGLPFLLVLCSPLLTATV